MKKLSFLLILITIVIAFASCTGDDDDDNNTNNNNNNTEDPTGSVEFRIRFKTPTGPELGWADVKLYESTEARDKGWPAVDSNVTDGDNTPHIAPFYKIPIKYYYVRAFYENQGKQYQGDDEVQIVKDDTITYFMTVTEL